MTSTAGPVSSAALKAGKATKEHNYDDGHDHHHHDRSMANKRRKTMGVEIKADDFIAV